MKYLENGVRLIKSSMSKYRSLWIIIAASIIVLGVFLLLIFKYFPQYSRLSVLAVLTIAAMSAFPVVPHELIILYLSNYYTPITVTLLTLAGSTFAEYLNYKLVSIFFKIPKLNAQKKRKLFKKAMHYFLKMPFVSVFVAAIAFIPFSPFRIIAPMSKYPVKKYITAIVFGRAPRFYLIAYFGYVFEIPNEIIIGLLILVLILYVISRMRSKPEKTEINDNSELSECADNDTENPLIK